MGTRFGSQIRQLDLIEESTGASFYTILAPLATDARLTLYPGNTTNAFDIASASIHAGTSLAVVGDLDADASSTPSPASPARSMRRARAACASSPFPSSAASSGRRWSSPLPTTG